MSPERFVKGDSERTFGPHVSDCSFRELVSPGLCSLASRAQFCALSTAKLASSAALRGCESRLASLASECGCNVRAFDG